MIGAAIDIGTNTFRLLVARAGNEGVEPLVRELVPVRLGEGLGRDRRLAAAAKCRAMATLVRFRDILKDCAPDTLRVCATQALRQAADGPAWIEEVGTRLGIDIQVVSSREEALLGLAGALAGALAGGAMASPLPGPLLLVDVGGGSTEMVLAVDPDHPFSPANRVAGAELGAVGLTERFLPSAHAAAAGMAEAIAALSGHIEAGLAAACQGFDRPPDRENLAILAIGGTATALAALHLGLDRYDGKQVHGHDLRVADLDRMWERLRGLDPAQRNLLPGLGQGRGEIILAGLRIYQMLLARLAAPLMRVSDTGLLEGILLSALAAAGPGRPTPT